jgi:hypothetical protein
MTDVYIPEPNLVTPSQQRDDDWTSTTAVLKEEQEEDWNESISELYEWVGMACLGAQRYDENLSSD